MGTDTARPGWPSSTCSLQSCSAAGRPTVESVAPAFRRVGVEDEMFVHVSELDSGAWSSGPVEGPAHDWERVMAWDPATEETVPSNVCVLVAPEAALRARGWDGCDDTIREAVRAWRSDGCPA